MTSRNRRQLIVGRHTGVGHVVGNDQLETGRRDDLVDRHARMHRSQPHPVVGRLEVECAEVRHHSADLEESRCDRSERACSVVAHAAHDVDLLDEDLRGVVRDPVARDVIDGVARRTTEAEQLCLRLVPVTDAGKVLVAELVDLAATHHHVTFAVPEHAEHLRIRVPRLDDRVDLQRLAVGRVRIGAGAQRRRREHGVAVGHHESGSNVSRANRPPIIGIVPIGLQSHSPSPRKHSAIATAQTSARVKSVPLICSAPTTRW